ncbi:MAG: hypothetical protein N2Z70_03235 [Bdellovibrionaceae bacterium]|jgi:hypothetical protein|nr:hypothetical protein [Pseudobdellovibrionaceae bacterium]
MNYPQTQTLVLSFGLIFLTACGMSLVDTKSYNSPDRSQPKVTVQSLKPADHPFAPMFLTPHLSVQLNLDQEGSWTYELTYSGALGSQKTNVIWDKNDTFTFHGTDKSVLLLSCGNTDEHELSINVTSGNNKNSLQLRLLCPRNVDLSDQAQKEKFEQELKRGQRPMLIGRMIVPAGIRSDWVISRSQAIWIYSLESLALRHEQAGDVQIGLNPERFAKLRDSAKSFHLSQQWAKLQDQYPHFQNILSELKALFPSSFMIPQNSSYLQFLYKELPTLHIYIHRMQGFLNIRSRATPGDKGLDGKDISPDFYKNKIQVAAPKGQDGATGDLTVKTHTALESCFPRVLSTHSGLNNASNRCPVTYTVCAGSTPGTPGLPGQDGQLEGLPGLDGFPSLPAPIVLLDIGNMASKTGTTQGGHILFDLLPAPPAPGGQGSPGQSGGEGGKGGAAKCVQESRNKAVVHYFPDGQKGKDAPYGKQGDLGPSLSCFPASVFAGNNSIKLGPLADSCGADQSKSLSEKVQLTPVPNYTRQPQPGVHYPFWILPSEQTVSRDSRKNQSYETYATEAPYTMDYVSWRQAQWLPKEFRAEVLQPDSSTPKEPLPPINNEPAKDFMIPRERPVW